MVEMATSFEQDLRYRQPGTAMLGVRQPDGARVVLLADDIVAVDIAATNLLLAAEAERLRGKGLITGGPEPIHETTDGLLALDDQHIYQLVHRDKQRPEVAIYERTG
ncbi:hypothetical protein [Actinophytocola glycyrrhizae]|uniref:Uncharacterized protein n=1 Tax=Actinophytocola glycyrrhizae TaxID=2044873 RepID=A0ABV9SEY2_9PSEU